MPVNVSVQAAVTAVLATALTAAACAPATTQRGTRGVASTNAPDSGNQTPSASRAGFDEPRFHELLLAGRFAEADATLSAAADEHARARPRARSGSASSPADAWIVDARAWLRIARRDWHRHDPKPSARTLSTVENQPSALLDAGLGAAHDAWPGADSNLLGIASQAADALEARDTTEARLFHAVVLAAIAAAQEERDLLAIALAQAQDLEWGLREAEHPLPPSFQVTRVAGDMWLQVHRYADARNAYLSATDREPRDARAWLGLARAEEKLGNVPESIEAYRTFVQRWNTDDPESPELVEARAALAEGRR